MALSVTVAVAVTATATLAACDVASTGPEDDPPYTPAAPVHDSVFAFVDVHVVPMDVPGVLSNQVVVVRNGRIDVVGSAVSVTVPESATVIDGEGGYLMPGLADMHVHVRRSEMDRYVPWGVTTVRNMWGYPDALALQAEVEAGELLAPTIYTVSPGLDGTPASWPYTQFVLTPEEADGVVQAQWDAGYRTLKMYQNLTLDAYDAIVEAAGARGMDFVGHVPSRVPLEHVIASGQRSIEHLGGYQVESDPEVLEARILETVAAGTWNCPTLVVQQVLGNPRAATIRQLIGRLHEAGANLLVGTDSGIDASQPGISILQELDNFVAAGLTPWEALRGATSEAARFLGEEDELGSVREGLRADLILLRQNPLDDVGALEGRLGVMARGVWVGDASR